MFRFAMLPDAWFAGFFDADGSVGISAPPTRPHELYARVWQVVPEPLELFKERFGGAIQVQHQETGTKRTVWVWSIRGRRVGAFLEDIYPYLVVKRDRVGLALEFRDRCLYGDLKMNTGRGTPRTKAFNAEVRERRDLVKEAMHTLNRRGV